MLLAVGVLALAGQIAYGLSTVTKMEKAQMRSVLELVLDQPSVVRIIFDQ